VRRSRTATGRCAALATALLSALVLMLAAGTVEAAQALASRTVAESSADAETRDCTEHDDTLQDVRQPSAARSGRRLLLPVRTGRLLCAIAPSAARQPGAAPPARSGAHRPGLPRPTPGDATSVLQVFRC
jgi:hypothetical protein